MLCGVFAEENTNDILKKSRRPVEFSANIFQEKIIKGFKDIDAEMEVVSAPFVGSYPNASEIKYFNESDFGQCKYKYVSFNNIWGVRNFSRAKAIKKSIGDFIDSKDNEKFIIVYSPHTPFLEAAVYAKEKDPRIKICLLVPDLPQYMNLSSDKSLIYTFAKKYDIKTMYKAMEYVDAYVLLTEQMKELLPIGSKPYFVAEGILEECRKQSFENIEEAKNIVYTGKLDVKFGIKELVQAFMQIEDDSLKLVLCGTGDCLKYIKACAKKDTRIIFTGQITPDEAHKWQEKASVLINPRPNNEEYTKYSFPSKIIEYLMTEKAVIAYMLDGMPIEYRKFIYEIKDLNNPIDDIKNTIIFAMKSDINEKKQKFEAFYDYASRELKAEKIALKIVNMMRQLWR